MTASTSSMRAGLSQSIVMLRTTKVQPGACHAQDQATTTLHEFTHAPGVYQPGTEDLGYGYDAASQLSAQDALNNADSYALYANGKRTSL